MTTIPEIKVWLANYHLRLPSIITDSQTSHAALAYIEQLESELSALRAQTTPRPISEAPKDGTWVLAEWPVQCKDRAYPGWHVVRWWAETRPGLSSKYDGWHDDAGLPCDQPERTCWHPLPALPPAPTEEVKG